MAFISLVKTSYPTPGGGGKRGYAHCKTDEALGPSNAAEEAPRYRTPNADEAEKQCGGGGTKATKTMEL